MPSPLLLQVTKNCLRSGVRHHSAGPSRNFATALREWTRLLPGRQLTESQEAQCHFPVGGVGSSPLGNVLDSGQGYQTCHGVDEDCEYLGGMPTT